MEENGKNSKFHFLYQYNDALLKDLESMIQEKQSRYSNAFRNRASLGKSQQLHIGMQPTGEFDYYQFKDEQ